MSGTCTGRAPSRTLRHAGAWLLATIALASFALLPTVAGATTWHVRPDGGDADACNGRADVAAPAAVDGNCAWNHPFIALPPGGEPRIRGGDTLRIAPGSYRMGLGAPDTGACAREYSWDCHMPPVPSGRSADRPTRIVGTDADGRCRVRPQLWGSERAARLIDLSGSRHVELRCLELTDRSDCIEHHCHGGGCKGEVAACARDAPPFGDWAGTGVYARDATDVRVVDVDVHGLAVRGFHAGGARDWTLERVRIHANGWSGWDGDLGDGDSANAGTLRFVDVEIAWNGCGERWRTREIFGCWAQQSGGYGDGLGTAASGGHWIFEGGSVHHNTSDGLDLLYLHPGARVDIRGLHAHANAGNQIKTSGDARIVESRIDGDCGAFAAGKHASRNMREGDHCRALGNAIVVALQPGGQVELIDNTITGTGDCLVVAEGGDATARLTLSGNTLRGARRHADPARNACGFYAHKSTARITRTTNHISNAR